MTTTTETQIAQVLTGILHCADTAAEKSFKEVEHLPAMINAIAAVDSQNTEAFFHVLLYPITKMVEGLLNHAIKDSHQARFIFQHADFVEAQFQSLFLKYEGNVCCADKTRTVIRKLVKFYIEGTRITFNYNQEYTFHLPKNLFSTHNEIVGFFEAVFGLYYGRSDRYVAAYQAIALRFDIPT